MSTEPQFADYSIELISFFLLFLVFAFYNSRVSLVVRGNQLLAFFVLFMNPNPIFLFAPICIETCSNQQFFGRKL